MGFSSGATSMDALIDKIADDLIATGAWGTADSFLAGGASPAIRALQHLTDTTFFVYLKRQLTTPSGNSGQVNEILVQVSTGFNTSTHVPSGTIQTTGIPAECGVQGGANPTANNKAGTYWFWSDASGVTFMVTWAASTVQDYSVFFTLERNTTKEYADGYSNFFVMSLTNTNYTFGSSSSIGQYYGNSATTSNWDAQRARVLRPFNLVEYDDENTCVASLFGAYRSPGNSKVYFAFPYFANTQALLQRSLIAMSKRFFKIEVGTGLADGDLITYVDGGPTLTYLVKTLQSPDSAAYLPWAIRQA